MDNSDSHIDKKIKLDNPDMSSSEQPKRRIFLNCWRTSSRS